MGLEPLQKHTDTHIHKHNCDCVKSPLVHVVYEAAAVGPVVEGGANRVHHQPLLMRRLGHLPHL